MAPDRAPLDDPVGAFVHRIHPDDHPPGGGTPGGRDGRDTREGPASDPLPLEGLRIVVDDLVAVEGLVSGAGNPDWRRTHAPEPETAPALARLVEAGASLVGTTVVDELGLGTIGINVQEGTPRNPVAPDSVPGGSAGGAAAAVAAELADLALVADTTGGARVPASVCGLYGARITPGRVVLDGMVVRSAELDAVGILARDATTLWLSVRELLGGAPGPTGGAPIERLVLAEDVWAVADTEVVDAMLPQLQRIALRVAVEPLEQLAAGGALRAWAHAQDVLVGRGAWAAHGAWFTQVNPTTALDVKQRIDAARDLDEAAASAAAVVRDAARAAVLEVLGAHGALVVPTTPAIAPLLTDTDAELHDFRDRTAMLTCVAGLAGLPQVSVPFVQLAEYPVGLSLVGPPGSDERLVALAGAIGRPT